MKPYSEREVFSKRALAIFRRATKLVEQLDPHLDERGREIRCHEIARALGRILKLEVVDGQSVGVDHSWLMIDRTTLLDPYAPARMPMVQLIDIGLPTLARFYYLHDGKFHDRRDDIRDNVVDWLVRLMGGEDKPHDHCAGVQCRTCDGWFCEDDMATDHMCHPCWANTFDDAACSQCNGRGCVGCDGTGVQ